MHWAYMSNFGQVSPKWSTICQLWPWMTPMSGYPSYLGPLGTYLVLLPFLHSGILHSPP